MAGGHILNGVKLKFLLNNFSLLWPIDTKLGVWVAYIKTQLGLLPRCLWSRSRSLLLKIEIQFPLNNFSLLSPIDTKLGACNQCNQNNGIIFLHCHLSFLIPVVSILGWIVENLVSSHCGVSCIHIKWIVFHPAESILWL